MGKNKQKNSGGGNFNNNGDITISGSFNGDGEGPPKQPIAELVKQEPLTIFGKKVQTHWFTLAGIIGLGADLLAYAQGMDFLTSHPWLLMMIPFGFLLCLLSLVVKFADGQLFLFLGKNIVVRKEALMQEEYAFSPCPHCGGRLSLVQTKERTYLQCSIYSNNPLHQFDFSPKLFDPRYYPAQ